MKIDELIKVLKMKVLVFMKLDAVGRVAISKQKEEKIK